MKREALEDLCEITIGRTPSRSEPRFWGPGYPWMSIADMGQGHDLTRTKEQITPEGARGGRLVPVGTVLLSFKLSIGKVGIATTPLYTNEAIAALTIRDPAKLDERYLMRVLEAMNLSAGSNRAAMGATLNLPKLRSISIPVTSIREQRRIAAILDQADSLRAKRRQTVEALSDLRRSVFVSMFEGQTAPNARFGDLVRSQQIGLDRRASAQGPEGAWEYVKMDCITRDGRLDLSSIVRVSASQAEAAKFVLKEGDLLLNTRNSRELVGKTAVYRGGPRLYNNNIMRIRFREDVLPTYVHAHLWSRSGKKQLDECKAGTTNVFAVYAKSLNEISVPLPPLALQLQYDEIVRRTEERSAELMKSSAACDDLFHSLQQRAFRGEL